MTLREMLEAIMNELGIELDGEKEAPEDSAADDTEDAAEGETKPEKD